MTSPYFFTDRDGDLLLVTASHSESNAVDLMVTEARTRNRVAVTVPAQRLGEVVAAMYRAAGRPAPVVLDADEVADEWVRVPGRGGV